jgi:hypothetical protein
MLEPRGDTAGIVELFPGVAGDSLDWAAHSANTNHAMPAFAHPY